MKKKPYNLFEGMDIDMPRVTSRRKATRKLPAPPFDDSYLDNTMRMVGNVGIFTVGALGTIEVVNILSNIRQ